MKYEDRQVADIYFDKEDKLYRAVVEYYVHLDVGTSGLHRIAVDVSFSGVGTETFPQIEAMAYSAAEAMISLLPTSAAP
ncbi:hypothetical protein [Neorhizobium galegae]|uniref:hypothetical protein n=1 Tax=Neorhizobium galegae TaxID=399 RepID=UPI001F3C6887|nr:hypothetical protein [Neorhizobium galegae]UIK05000.1 hypothetical protein LZK81_20485 [Neorhizobium galegae]